MPPLSDFIAKSFDSFIIILKFLAKTMELFLDIQLAVEFYKILACFYFGKVDQVIFSSNNAIKWIGLRHISYWLIVL